MSDLHPDPVEEFRGRVAAAFAVPWRVERTAEGFVARLPMSRTAAVATDDVAASDELLMTVVADAATRRFSWSTRRVSARDSDISSRSLTGYRRTIDSARVTGGRRTWNFRRTPEGLVPNPQAPESSDGREADLRRIAAELGWTEEQGSTNAPRFARNLPPKRTLILVAAFAGFVVLFIVGVAGFIAVSVFGSFGR